MPTQKRSLQICYQRGIAVQSARMGIKCALNLMATGNIKEARGLLKASKAAFEMVEYVIDPYPRVDLNMARTLREDTDKAIRLLGRRKTTVGEAFTAIERIETSVDALEKSVRKSCKGKLPRYAGR